MLTQHPTNRMINMGFALIICIFALIVAISLSEIAALQKKSRTITQTDIPTLYVSTSMESLINQTLGSLRSWMLLNDENFKKELQEHWVNIRIEEEQLVQLSRNWKHSAEKFQLDELRNMLNMFEKTQFEILDLVHKDVNLPANQLIAERITPLFQSMANQIADLIDQEEQQALNPERKQLMTAIFRYRHTLGKALAHLRSYILTDKEQFIAEFHEVWEKNLQYQDLLQTMNELLTDSGQKTIVELVQKRDTLSSLTQATFAIRQSEDYNRAHYLLRTQAIVMGQKIKDILDQMIVDHQRVLQHDNTVMSDSIDDFKNKMVAASLIAVLVTIWLGVRIYFKLSAAQENIDRRAALIDQNIMIAYLDQQGNVNDITNFLCRALHGIRSDFVGKPSYYFLPDGEYDPRYTEIIRTIRTGHIWEGEIEITHADHEKTWLYSKIIPTTENKQRRDYTNILQDITDKKRIEELSITDKLTSLYNRRHLRQYTGTAAETCTAHRYQLCFVYSGY